MRLHLHPNRDGSLRANNAELRGSVPKQVAGKWTGEGARLTSRLLPFTRTHGVKTCCVHDVRTRSVVRSVSARIYGRCILTKQNRLTE